MKKWEYKVIAVDIGVLRTNYDKTEGQLNELGEKGWELVASALGQKLILKRELK